MTDDGRPPAVPQQLDAYLFYLVAHVDHAYSREMARALAAAKMSRPQWRSLAALGFRPGQSIGELAEMTLLERSTLSRVIDRLEAAGLVERRPRTSDNRVVEVHLSAAGREGLERVHRVASRQYRHAVAGLEERELAELDRLLKHILANLNRHPFS